MDIPFGIPFDFITGDLITQITQTSPILLGIFFFIFVIFAYKALQIFIKAIVVGIIAASFPIIATVLGFSVPLSLTSMLWFGILGAGAFIVYSLIMGGVRTSRAVVSPFRGTFKPKPGDHHHHYKTIVVKEEDKKEKD
jgi:hypothetical protein